MFNGGSSSSAGAGGDTCTPSNSTTQTQGKGALKDLARGLLMTTTATATASASGRGGGGSTTTTTTTTTTTPPLNLPLPLPLRRKEEVRTDWRNFTTTMGTTTMGTTPSSLMIPPPLQQLQLQYLPSHILNHLPPPPSSSTAPTTTTTTSIQKNLKNLLISPPPSTTSSSSSSSWIGDFHSFQQQQKQQQQQGILQDGGGGGVGRMEERTQFHFQRIQQQQQQVMMEREQQYYLLQQQQQQQQLQHQQQQQALTQGGGEEGGEVEWQRKFQAFQLSEEGKGGINNSPFFPSSTPVASVDASLPGVGMGGRSQYNDTFPWSNSITHEDHSPPLHPEGEMTQPPQQESIVIEGETPTTRLQRTAQLLSRTLGEDPRFGKSQFLRFMGEVGEGMERVVEGGVVEGGSVSTSTTSGSLDSLGRFGGGRSMEGGFTASTADYLDGPLRDVTFPEGMEETEDGPPFSAHLAAQAFLNDPPSSLGMREAPLGRPGSWEEQFLDPFDLPLEEGELSPPRNYQQASTSGQGNSVIPSPLKVFEEMPRVLEEEREVSLEEWVTTQDREVHLQGEEGYTDVEGAGDVSHDMDGSREFRGRLGRLRGREQGGDWVYGMVGGGGEEDREERRLYDLDMASSEGGVEKESPEWQREFIRKMEEHSASGVEYEGLQEEREREERGGRETSTSYQFISSNPFIQVPQAHLRSPEFHTTLTESILSLEAQVQQSPRDSGAWLELGRLQQENENEGEAISALREAIVQDPGNIDAYLAIAVSFTNENLTGQAQEALGEWVRRNPRYAHIITEDPSLDGLLRREVGTTSSSEVHEALISAYLQAAAQGGPLVRLEGGEEVTIDPDVQAALGVLFNINNDYPKAIDCFQTAVSVRPRDFQLWNKLGATMANSGQSEKAMEAYFNALQIHPSYIRVRYNLAIACMQLGHYQEAAGYLLAALSIQEASMKHVMQKATPELMPEMRQLHTGQSESVWGGLKLLLSTYIRRDDLTEACDNHDLNAFRQDFDF